MLELFQAPSFCAFVVVVVSFIVGVFLLRRHILLEAAGDLAQLTQKWKVTAVNLSFGALAGALGGLNLTLTKTTFTLIVGQYKEGDDIGSGILEVISSPVLWAVSMTLVGTYLLQMKSNVDGLAQCSAMIVISSHCVTEEVVAAMGGILYFQDYKQFDTLAWVAFPTGNVLAVVAVIALAHFRSHGEIESKAGGNDKTIATHGNPTYEVHSIGCMPSPHKVVRPSPLKVVQPSPSPKPYTMPVADLPQAEEEPSAWVTMVVPLPAAPETPIATPRMDPPRTPPSLHTCSSSASPSRALLPQDDPLATASPQLRFSPMVLRSTGPFWSPGTWQGHASPMRASPPASTSTTPVASPTAGAQSISKISPCVEAA